MMRASPKRGSLWLILVVVGIVMAMVIVRSAWPLIFS